MEEKLHVPNKKHLIKDDSHPKSGNVIIVSRKTQMKEAIEKAMSILMNN